MYINRNTLLHGAVCKENSWHLAACLKKYPGSWKYQWLEKSIKTMGPSKTFWGCVIRSKNGLFLLTFSSSNYKIFMLDILAHDIATAMVFIWGDRGIQNSLRGIFVCWDYVEKWNQFLKKMSISAFLQIYSRLFCSYLSDRISLRGDFVFKTNG